MDSIINRISEIGMVPVVTIYQEDHILPLAKSLFQGGIDVIEITFRSKYALQAIETIHKNIPEILLGAGTVSTIEQADHAVKAGADFIVTPGFNVEITLWCLEHKIPILPGISTASELEQALSYGIHNVKFFPAESSGGAQKIKDLSAPYPNVNFLPTGGIHIENMHEYLSIPSVIAIGGSFMASKEKMLSNDWLGIEEQTRLSVKHMLDFQLIHIGINHNSKAMADESAKVLCDIFNFTYYSKPKSSFAGVGFEMLHEPGPGNNGHIGIYTPYPERALYHLKKHNIHPIESTITRNKITNKVNFVYLDLNISGFSIHLINPDVKMEV